MSGQEYSESVEKEFAVSGNPLVRVRNVSGRTKVHVGPAGTLRVVARKYVRGWSEERAKRLLDNVEIRLEQEGDEVRIMPQLSEQERNWVEMFRGGHVAVDFDVTVPREARLDAHTVSGELAIAGPRGPLEVHSVSGEIDLSDVQGPLRVKTVSGDVTCADFCGALDANSVSGDLAFRASRLRGAQIVSVSGDIAIDGELEPGDEHRFKTISGDVELALAGDSYAADFSTMSGDFGCACDASITHEDRRHQHVVIGGGASRLRVKTVSGDFQIKRSGSALPQAGPSAGAAEEADLPPRVDAAAQAGATSARAILERLARGELGVDEAAEALDAARRARGPEAPFPPEPPEATGAPGMGRRVLRIQVIERGKNKVNFAIPLAIARLGKTKIAASGLVRTHLQRFGIDLDEVLRSIGHPGTIVDITDDEDRVLITIE